MYEVKFHPSFPKDLRRLPKSLILKLKNIIEEIKINPEIGDKLHGDLNGYYSCHLKCAGVDYRLCYTINESIIYFLMFKTRENYYDELKRRI